MGIHTGTLPRSVTQERHSMHSHVQRGNEMTSCLSLVKWVAQLPKLGQKSKIEIGKLFRVMIFIQEVEAY